MNYKHLFATIFFFINLYLFQIAAVSISETSSYPQLCQLAVENEEVFANFKRYPAYQAILEHVSYEHGKEYLDIILKEDPELVSLFNKFRENDLLGNPIVYDYGQYGIFSPTTLRYIKVARDLRKKFGDMSHMRVVEIGGGYGGQCKILSDLCGFASYTIIDLPEAVKLANKYLSALKG